MRVWIVYSCALVAFIISGIAEHRCSAQEAPKSDVTPGKVGNQFKGFVQEVISALFKAGPLTLTEGSIRIKPDSKKPKEEPGLIGPILVFAENIKKEHPKYIGKTYEIRIQVRGGEIKVVLHIGSDQGKKKEDNPAAKSAVVSGNDPCTIVIAVGGNGGKGGLAIAKASGMGSLAIAVGGNGGKGQLSGKMAGNGGRGGEGIAITTASNCISLSYGGNGGLAWEKGTENVQKWKPTFEDPIPPKNSGIGGSGGNAKSLCDGKNSAALAYGGDGQKGADALHDEQSGGQGGHGGFAASQGTSPHFISEAVAGSGSSGGNSGLNGTPGEGGQHGRSRAISSGPGARSLAKNGNRGSNGKKLEEIK